MAFTPPYDRFSDAEITVDLLDDLAARGPGGLIRVAYREADYAVTHSRHEDWRRPTVVVYGHGDLVSDLVHYRGDLEEIAAALTDHARDETTRWIGQNLHTCRLHKKLRQHLNTLGWYMDRRPRYKTGEDETRYVTDLLTWRNDRRFTLALRSARRRPEDLDVTVDLHYQDRHLTTWTETLTYDTPDPRFTRLLKDQARSAPDTRA
ncbi:hypothetical protein ACOQFV_02515 [Nocardiopsis changdeensis]|uniref:DUF2470 domain-containing protein n=1 Tax=Nocardiopsis changdeensis TaxID=2831969 RepID=A0ABX8BL95_9ACTN|nr:MULTISPECIES: hypothetical protein [Nocardiopsis]QUX22510.1 hypothetical protein KGD84_30090 [Nocardiopsis changdeensis]QYX38452.1 hypothetical protein K1J57_07470 [Nocardiopsis sp. MT53]